MTGQTIGHYHVVDKLGHGGMGVVYKARDARLDRFVALKVLPEGYVADDERRKRLVQEARAASALNHPNIITIYDIDHANGADFIAMEFVDGQTLDARIGKTGLPAVEALTIASQIADALSAAHNGKLVHRDLKPSNVMVTEAGQVKVLDFGLAKPVERAAPKPAPDGATLTDPGVRSREGAIVGTVSYMSPEQAEGKKLDARSDIFSFGIVLYEMLTGQRPFRGDTSVSTLGAILHEEPKPVTALSASLPDELDRIVARCLRKAPGRRFQHMADLKVALDEVREEIESGRARRVTAAPVVPQARRWPWIALAACGFVVAGIATWFATRPVLQQPSYRFRQLTFDSGLTTSPAISPDGKLVAYASDRASGSDLDLFVQQVSGGKPVRLTDHPADDSEPSFSPDGSRIVFRSKRDGGGLYTVPALGGDTRLLTPHGSLPRFSPDGTLVTFQIGQFLREAGVYTVPASGGPAKKVETGVPHAEAPIWSPDGKWILFAGALEGQIVNEWFVVPAEGGKATAAGVPQTVRGQFPAQWLSDGRVLTLSGGFDNTVRARAVRLDGNHRAAGLDPLWSVPARMAYLRTSIAGGHFVGAVLQPNQQIWSVPIDGANGRPTGPPQMITRGTGSNSYPTVSRDGRLLAYNSSKSGSRDLWLRDPATGSERALTGSNLSFGRGELSPDGGTAAFTRPRLGLFTMPTNGGGEIKVCECPFMNTILGWTPDSRQVVTTRGRPLELILIDTRDGKVTPLLKHPKFDLHRGQFSPDGNLLYFYTRRHGFIDIWAQRLDPATKRPRGEPFSVLEFHEAKRPLESQFSKAVTRDRFFWSMEEITGNIWIIDRE